MGTVMGLAQFTEWEMRWIALGMKAWSWRRRA